MAEALGVAASVIAVVELAGKVWSVCWQYYSVRPKIYSSNVPQLVLILFIWG